MSEETIISTEFLTVDVTVSRKTDGKLSAIYMPLKTLVTKKKAVISYKLVTGPAGLVFKNIAIVPETTMPLNQNDFSPACICGDGLLMTIHDNDRDTKVTTYEVTLWVLDPLSNKEVPLDPQIINR